MSRFDYADPGTDPAYCNDLAPEPFDEDRADVADYIVSLEHVPDMDRLCGFPSPPTSDGRTVESFGLLVLAYILGSDVEVYGLLPLDSLHAAEHAARIAVGAHEILPLAVDRISAVRMRLLRCIATLERPVTVDTSIPVTVVSTGDGGSRVPVVPIPVVPVAPVHSASMEF